MESVQPYRVAALGPEGAQMEAEVGIDGRVGMMASNDHSDPDK